MSTSLYLCCMCMQSFLSADWLRQENKKLNVQIISSGKMCCFESLVCSSTINACSARQMVMKVDTFFKQIFLPVWGNHSTQRKPTTFGSGWRISIVQHQYCKEKQQKWEYFHLIWIAGWHILICFDWFRKYTHSIKIRFLTSLKYLSCLLCYLGIYRKPVIRETYSDIMKWTNIWQFPLPAAHCHSTTSNSQYQ
jgi:hypothetical protein